MKIANRIILAILCTCLTATLAQAGSEVQMNQSTTIKASVKNTTSSSALAAVKLTGYDNTGTIIGNLCKSAWLGAGRTAKVEFSWQAPNYATGVYWASKVEVGAVCPESVSNDDDEHDDDDDHRGHH